MSRIGGDETQAGELRRPPASAGSWWTAALTLLLRWRVAKKR